MSADAAVEQYLAGVKQLLDFIEAGGANRGQVVEAVLKHVGLEPGNPWCSAAVSYAGYRAFMSVNARTRRRGSAWPLKCTGSVAELAADAEQRGALVSTPQRGDVFVMYFASLRRFAHTGVVDQVIDGLTCLTFEGNTTFPAGDPYEPKRPANAQQNEREGWGEFVRVRTFGPKDRFIRWTQLMTL